MVHVMDNHFVDVETYSIVNPYKHLKTGMKLFICSSVCVCVHMKHVNIVKVLYDM